MQEISEVLRELAAQLGTTVEYLWPYIVKNVTYEWLGNFMVGMIMLFVGYIGLYVTWRRFNKTYTMHENAYEQQRLWNSIIDDHGRMVQMGRQADSVLAHKGMTREEAFAERSRWERIGRDTPRRDAVYTMAFIVTGIFSAVGTVATLVCIASINRLLAPEAVALKELLGRIQ
jgi:hypothetical protein